jgi:hypothetical protein
MNSADAKPLKVGATTLFKYGRIRPYRTSPATKRAALLAIVEAGTVSIMRFV